MTFNFEHMLPSIFLLSIVPSGMSSSSHKGKSKNLRTLNVFHLFSFHIFPGPLISIFLAQSTGASAIKDIQSILNSELVLVEFLYASCVCVCVYNLPQEYKQRS